VHGLIKIRLVINAGTRNSDEEQNGQQHHFLLDQQPTPKETAVRKQRGQKSGSKTGRKKGIPVSANQQNFNRDVGINFLNGQSDDQSSVNPMIAGENVEKRKKKRKRRVLL
jgi:hypothetical protein